MSHNLVPGDRPEHHDSRTRDARDWYEAVSAASLDRLSAGQIGGLLGEALEQLGQVLAFVAQEQGQAVELRKWRMTVREAFRNAIRYQQARVSPDARDQAALYRTVAAKLGADVGTIEDAWPRGAGASAAGPDGSVTLTPADRVTVVGAISDAIYCGTEPDHDGGPDAARLAAYVSLGRTLGDDR